MIQTSQPKHPVICYVATGDYHTMANTELREREAFGYPPYARLIRFMLHHANPTLLNNTANHFASLLRHRFQHRVMGPVSAAIEMLRGEHRVEITLKIESSLSMTSARSSIREAMKILATNAEHRNVKIEVDVDAL